MPLYDTLTRNQNLVVGGVAALAGLAVVRVALGRSALAKRAAKRRERMAKQKKGKVYLFQYIRMDGVATNISPFCAAVETYLRLTDTPYEVITHKGDPAEISPSGRFPYIELNGEGVCDSELIVQHVAKVFGHTAAEPEGAYARGVSLAVVRFFTRSYKLHFMRHSWVDNLPSIVTAYAHAFDGVPPFILRFALRNFRKEYVTMLNLEGQGDLVDAEYHAQWLQEMQAAEGILGAWLEAQQGAGAGKAPGGGGAPLSDYAVATSYAWLRRSMMLEDCPAVRCLQQSPVLRRFVAHVEERAFPDIEAVVPGLTKITIMQ